MTDPFFQTAQNNGTTNGNNEETDKKQNQESIQALLEQQRQIQEKYKELKAIAQNEELTNEQSQELQNQIDKLLALYTKNKETLALLTTTIEGEKQIYTNKNISVQKESNSKKLSIQGIAIGCGSIFTLLIGLFALIFFRVIKNPNSFNGLINATTAIQLTQVFCIIFFGLLFIFSLWILIINLYRLINIKNKNKIKEIFGSLLGLILLVATLVVGSMVFSKLRGITPDTFINQNQIVTAYAIMADKGKDTKTVRIGSDPSLVLIAPINIIYQVNTSLLERQMINKYGDIKLAKLELDCGNGKGLNDISSNAQGQCFYLNKGTKNIGLKVTFIKNQTNEQSSMTTSVGSISILSEIGVTTNKGQTSSPYTDIIVGKNPIKVTYDASNVFKDLNLQTYDIIRDADADGVTDKSNYSTYTHVYTKADIYHVNIRFPTVNNYIYTFPIRIEQSDVPVAEIEYSMVTTTQCNITASFPGENPDIANYSFNIINKASNATIDTINTKDPSISYIFPGDGVYAIQLYFVTQEGKQGSAESENIEIGGSKYQVLYDIYTKSPTMPNFSQVSDKNNVIIRELPTVLRVNITNISPSSPTTNTTVSIKDASRIGDAPTPIIGKNHIYDTTIEDTKDYIITINITDPNHEDMIYSKTINVSVQRDDIIPRLVITPDTVGTSPFNVTFDASTTTVNNPNDEIIYFTRDFGDGNVETNTSQSIIKHTYNYNYETENGEFHPSVTLKTKNGRTVSTESTILVKKPVDNVSISLDSHPAQLATAGDKVDMSISVNGTPTKIIWDFGNGHTLECKGRECIEVSQVFTEPGSYEIKVTVSYDNRADVEGSINLVVR